MGIKLPRIYTQEVWERNGSVEAHKKHIGKYYISWSQVSSFRDKKGYNTNLDGMHEYMKAYFFHEKWEDEGYAQHGLEVEAYICYHNYTEEQFKALPENDQNDFNNAVKRLSEEELAQLRSIEPLGNFQVEVIYAFEDIPVILMGFIDDMSTPDKKGYIAKLRDYKTKSPKKRLELYDVGVMQLELYTAGLAQDGFTVGSAGHCVIERVFLEDHKAFFSAGATEPTPEAKLEAKLQHLRVGENIWYDDYPRAMDAERVEYCIQEVKDTIIEISEYYKTFEKFFKLKQDE